MIIADTGFWLALLDKKDTYHHQADQALQQYDEPYLSLEKYRTISKSTSVNDQTILRRMT